MVPKMVRLLLAPQTRACEGPDKGRYLDVRSLAASSMRSTIDYTSVKRAAVSACGLTDIEGERDIPGLCRDVCQVKAKVFEEITAHYGLGKVEGAARPLPSA